jgi:hypothetical protein
MLVYHPMYDPYHAAARIAFLVQDCGRAILEWDRARILDFFTLFPHLLQRLKLPKEHVGLR